MVDQTRKQVTITKQVCILDGLDEDGNPVYKEKQKKQVIWISDDPITYQLATAENSDVKEYAKIVSICRYMCNDVNKVGFAQASAGLIGNQIQDQEAIATNKIFRLCLQQTTSGQLFDCLTTTKNSKGKLSKFCIVTRQQETERKKGMVLIEKIITPTQYVDALYTRDAIKTKLPIVHLLMNELQVLQGKYEKHYSGHYLQAVKNKEQEIEQIKKETIDYNIEEQESERMKERKENKANSLSLR